MQSRYIGLTCIIKQRNSTHYVEVDRTEIIWDNLNPEFNKKFVLDYHFEIHQMLRFSVYDCDNERTKSLDKQDFLGMIECSLGEIVTGQAGVILYLLTRMISNGFFILMSFITYVT